MMVVLGDWSLPLRVMRGGLWATFVGMYGGGGGVAAPACYAGWSYRRFPWACFRQQYRRQVGSLPLRVTQGGLFDDLRGHAVRRRQRGDSLPRFRGATRFVRGPSCSSRAGGAAAVCVGAVSPAAL